MNNCFLSWLDGSEWRTYELDVDPTSASWGYSMKTQTQRTYGGRVVQILSCHIDTLTISGTLKQPYGQTAPAYMSQYVVNQSAPYGAFENRYAVMEEFAEAMRQCIECQGETKTPSRFCYPMLDWDGGVYLVGYTNVTYDMKSSVATYTLKFEVDNGFTDIKEAISSYGLDSIPDGVNWTRNIYNTPVTTWSDVRKALESLLQNAGTSAKTQSLYDYLDEVKKQEESSSAGAADAQSQNAQPTIDNVFSSFSSNSPTNELNSAYRSVFVPDFGASHGYGAW